MPGFSQRPAQRTTPIPQSVGQPSVSTVLPSSQASPPVTRRSPHTVMWQLRTPTNPKPGQALPPARAESRQSSQHSSHDAQPDRHTLPLRRACLRSARRHWRGAAELAQDRRAVRNARCTSSLHCRRCLRQSLMQACHAPPAEADAGSSRPASSSPQSTVTARLMTGPNRPHYYHPRPLRLCVRRLGLTSQCVRRIEYRLLHSTFR